LNFVVQKRGAATFQDLTDKQPEGGKHHLIGLVFVIRKQISQAREIGRCGIQRKKAHYF